MSDTKRVGVVLREDRKRARVGGLEVRLEMREEVGRLAKVVALADAVECDDRHARFDGGVELEEAPRAREHLLGLEEHDHVRVQDVTHKLSKVTEVVRVCARASRMQRRRRFVSVASEGSRGARAVLTEENVGIEQRFKLLLQQPCLGAAIDFMVTEEVRKGFGAVSVPRPRGFELTGLKPPLRRCRRDKFTPRGWCGGFPPPFDFSP